MTTSSAIAPDIDHICRTQLRRGAAAIERIGAGRNSRVFRVALDTVEVDGASDPQTVVLKFYRRDAGDTRDRLAAEFGGLQFLWENHIRAIARPIAADRERYCGFYGYIEGTPCDATAAADDVDRAVDFLASLKPLRARPGSERQPTASEAQFSVAAVAAAVRARLERLRQSARTGDGAALHEWIDAVLEPLARDVGAWCRAEADRAGVPFEGELDPALRILSPSDFGFHNAIRRPDGTLAFVDFEYFGWDDPAKTAADFVLHPGMAIDPTLGRRFMSRFLTAFGEDDRLTARVRIVYPLYGIKWCLIVLNDFLPDRAPAASATELSAVRRRQLTKADALAVRIAREYQVNPYCL